MGRLKAFFTNWWVLATLAALCATLIVWLVFGLLLTGLHGVRLGLIALVWLAYAGLAGWRWWRGKQAAKALAAAMTSAEDGESAAIADKMKGALERARALGKDALYALPWYVIIGPPGAGKTTLIQKSGLRLLNDEAAQGVGGTRNCDWWFTEDAVLIDTAGRYTSQDSDASRDAKGWTAFLATLRKARPLQPLNGIIVAIGLDELGTAPAVQLDRHVVAIRARIAELSKALGLVLPVYVLLTKGDLVAGFVEFFDDLSVEGRRAVVGATLPIALARPTAGDLAAAYDTMAQALADRLPTRLQAETDPARSGAALSLPARFIDLRARVVRLLDGVFGAGAHAGTQTGAGQLRGFYLTSGVQQGTPFDRLIGDMAATLGRANRARPQNARAFFVNRLFKEVMIPEAGLARPDAARRKREQMMRLGLFGAAGALGLFLAGAWAFSFSANSAAMKRTTATATAIANDSKGIDANNLVPLAASAADVLDLLDRIKADLPYGPVASANPPARLGFGLYRSNLADESARAYRDALQRYLLPRLILTAEHALSASASDPIAVYEPLKVYLMLGNRAGAKRDNDYILDWLENDLSMRDFPGPENEALRQRIIDHAKALLADTGRFGRQLTGPLLDPTLVETAQATVASMSPAERALALMQQQVTGDDWTLVGSALLRGEADSFGNPSEIAAARVPYLFTKTGFQKGFIPRVATIGQALDADRWMLGEGGASQAALDPAELGALYAAQYSKRWNDILALPQPGDYGRNAAALARVANAGASPLKKITDQVIVNTSGLLPAVKPPALPGGKLGAMTGKALAGDIKGSASGIAAATIQANFQSLRDYAAGDSAPLKQLLGALGKYQMALAQAAVGGATGGGAAGGGGSAALASAAADLSVAAANAQAGAPALANFIKQVAGGSSAAAETTRTQELRNAWVGGILPDCQSVIGKGYPFGDGPDLLPNDVNRVVGGVTGFARDTLGPYLRRDGAFWTWNNEPTVRGFTPLSARNFQRADAVQQMLGGNLVLRLSAITANKAPLRLRLAGVPIDLAPGTAGDRFSWSTGGAQVAELTAPATPQGAALALHEEGPWALFRLLGKAQKKNPLGVNRWRFVYSPDIALDVEVLGGPDPFKPDGPFSLRCPEKL